MTLDIGDFFSAQSVPDGTTVSYLNQAKPNSERKENQDDNIYEERWENEGGAYLDQFGIVPGVSRLVAEDDAFVECIRNFDEALANEDFDVAAAELNSAAEIYAAFQSVVATCFDDAIAHLTTIGGPAAPPHPLALPLIRKREAIAL